MKRTILFSLAGAAAAWAWGQPTIEQYYLGGFTGQFNLFELASHDFFAEMGGAVLIAANGSVIHNNYYWGDSVLNLRAVQRQNDNLYYFATNYNGPFCEVQNGLLLRHLYPMIGKMDSTGHVLALGRYMMNAGCQNVTDNLIITANKDAITWGRGEGFFAMKADSDLAHVWSRHFYHTGGFAFIKELPSGDLLAGINADTAGASVARLDANGNFIWCKSYIRPRGIVHDCIVQSDSSFIITGVTDSLVANDPKFFLVRLNGVGDVQWCRGYDSACDCLPTRSSRIVRAQDGNYVVLATYSHNCPARPLLMKIDLNGDTLWTRSAGVGGYEHESYDLLSCSDGGFLFDGQCVGDFWPYSDAAYLFKTDSMGHLPCSEQPPPAMVISDLFPQDSSFALTSVDGAVAMPTLVQDTVYGMITTIEGCTITSVPYRAGGKLRVYPNPNTGHFTMSFTDPPMAESYYSVYDTMGRLLYQRPLPSGATVEEVDLSRFGKGTYLIKFTDMDEVCYERVVVQ